MTMIGTMGMSRRGCRRRCCDLQDVCVWRHVGSRAKKIGYGKMKGSSACAGSGQEGQEVGSLPGKFGWKRCRG